MDQILNLDKVKGIITMPEFTDLLGRCFEKGTYCNESVAFLSSIDKQGVKSLGGIITSEFAPEETTNADTGEILKRPPLPPEFIKITNPDEMNAAALEYGRVLWPFQCHYATHTAQRYLDIFAKKNPDTQLSTQELLLLIHTRNLTKTSPDSKEYLEESSEFFTILPDSMQRADLWALNKTHPTGLVIFALKKQPDYIDLLILEQKLPSEEIDVDFGGFVRHSSKIFTKSVQDLAEQAYTTHTYNSGVLNVADGTVQLNSDLDKMMEA